MRIIIRRERCVRHSGNDRSDLDVATAETAKDSEAVHFGKMLSKAFHEAAMKVQPAVVMITNRPAMAKESAERTIAVR